MDLTKLQKNNKLKSFVSPNNGRAILLHNIKEAITGTILGVAFFIFIFTFFHVWTVKAQELTKLSIEQASTTPISEDDKIMALDLYSAVDVLKTDLLAPVDDKFKQDVIIELDKKKVESDVLASKYAKLYDGCKNK